MNGRFRWRRDVIALAQRRKHDVEEENGGFQADNRPVWCRADRVVKPLRSAFGHARLTHVRAVRGGVRRKVAVDEAVGVRPGSPPVDVGGRQHRGEQNAHQSDERSHSLKLH
jgi:hypothetical protein